MARRRLHGIHVIPRFATWGFRALVDLTVADGDPTVATIDLSDVVEHRQAVAHAMAAVNRALTEMLAAGHDAVLVEERHARQ